VINRLLITQPLFRPIFSYFHILYNFICTFLRYFIQIMHLSLKYRKTHSNSCNFSRGKYKLELNVIRVAVINLLITQPLFCPIFSNFHILYNLICTFLGNFIRTLHLSWKYRKTHSNLCNFSRGNINFITIIRLYIVRYPGCRFKTSHNSAPILTDFFKLPYIVQLYICTFPRYFIQIMHLSLKYRKTH
jgi:hypothetical protein